MGEYPFPVYFHGVPFYEVILRGVFGLFGWSEVKFPDGLHYTLIALFDLLVIGTVAALVRLRRAIDRPVLAFYALTALTLFAGLQWTDYKMLRDSGFTSGFNQGRYLLPLAALGGIAVATVVRALPVRLRGGLIAFVVIGLVVLNVLALGTMTWRFYA
jgi:hypothetical protein